MNPFKKDRVLEQARLLIGTTYDQLDCSHFVHKAFAQAGMVYTYRNSASFASDPDDRFESVGFNLDAGLLEPGDVIVFNGHMGIWDPDGCIILGGNEQCKNLKNKAPFLSSRSGGNRGPDYGQLKWWSGDYQVFRWSD